MRWTGVGADRAGEGHQVIVPGGRRMGGDVEGQTGRLAGQAGGDDGAGDVMFMDEVAPAVAGGSEVAKAALGEEAGDAGGPLGAAWAVDDAGPQDDGLMAGDGVVHHF